MRHAKERTGVFGSYLQARREALGYSVTTLSEKAGVSASGISDLELGGRQLTGRMARRLAGPLDVTPNELLIRAHVTPELPWERALPSAEEERREVTVVATDRELGLINEYLHYLRFRQWFSSEQNNPNASVTPNGGSA